MAIVLALVVTGCSSRPAADGPGLEAAAAYEHDAWNDLLHGHESDLVSCMESRGFRFWSEATWDYLTLGPHGLFGLSTPSAEQHYLTKYGYGVAQRVEVLRSELKNIEKPSNERYARSLPLPRREKYARALFGGEGVKGCVEYAQEDVVSVLGLPDGGPLGEEFGAALREAEETAQYRSWESRVVECLGRQGIDVEDGDLITLERPFLIRLLDLAGSKYEVDGDGNVHYDLKASELKGIDGRALAALRRDEMSTARAEAKCRTQAGTDAQLAVDQASAHLATDYASEVAQLRRAMEQFAASHMDEG